MQIINKKIKKYAHTTQTKWRKGNERRFVQKVKSDSVRPFARPVAISRAHHLTPCDKK